VGRVCSIIPAPDAVDAAWERYRALAAEAMETPTLLLDRAHVQRLAGADAQFRRAFLATERRESA
jgi:hypothetical protein